jgi:hypothetical protein
MIRDTVLQCIAFGLLLVAEPGMAESNPEADEIRGLGADLEPSQALMRSVTAFIEDATGDRLSVFQVKVFQRQLATWVEAVARGKTSGLERQAAAIRLLGRDRYETLEREFLEMLQSGNAEEAALAMGGLGRCLYSMTSKTVIKDQLNKAFKNLADEDPDNDPESEVLFSAAEALAYLDDASGVGVLTEALSPEYASAYRIRALRALATFQGQSGVSEDLRQALDDEDAAMAYQAFCLLERPLRGQRELYSPAMNQLHRLAQTLVSKGGLDDSERGLLSKACLALMDGVKKGALSEDEVNNVRLGTREIIARASERDAEFVATLFAWIARDEDGELIKEQLLTARSPRLQSRGALAIARLSKETQENFLPELLAMLDAQDVYVRNFALHSLRTYMGERAGTFVSDEEFEVEKARVKQALGASNH